MKKQISIFIGMLILCVITYAFGYQKGKALAPIPDKIEVVKYIDRIVEKNTMIADKKLKKTDKTVKITEANGTITESTISEVDIEDRQIQEFLAERMKLQEMSKVTFSSYDSGYGFDIGPTTDLKLNSDLEYLKKIYENEDHSLALFVKGGLEFESDLKFNNFKLASAKVGAVLLH